MTKILFICHGNICRSPMAEFILKDIASKQGRQEDYIIESCATSTEEIIRGVGNPIYPPAREMLREKAIPFHERQAVRLEKSDYEKYDFFVCMDGANFRNAKKILGGDHENKIKKLLTFAGEDGDVSDPWYTGDFHKAYEDIFRGCQGLFDYLEAQQ